MSDSFASDTRLSRHWATRRISFEAKSFRKNALITFLFISCAILLAPESPDQLASICERHNPTIVCRVW